VGFLWQYRGERAGQLEEAVAALDKDDPHWRLADIEERREQVPEAQNSAGAVVNAARLLPRGWPARSFEEGVRDLDRAPNARLDPDKAALLRKEMTDQAAALAEARKLAAMPRGRHRLSIAFNPLGTNLDEQQASRTVAVLLRFDALDRAQEGD